MASRLATASRHDATRAARFGHCRAVEAEKPEPLNDGCVAQRGFGGFGHRRHGGYAAIQWRCLLVAEIRRQLEDPGPREDVAVFREPAEKMRILRRKVVAVFAHALTFLRHVEDFAVVALAVEEIFAPGNAVADLERIAAHVYVDAVADFLDPADDLMAENSRTRIWPAAS